MHLHPHIARELADDTGRRRRAEAARASIGVDRERQVASTTGTARATRHATPWRLWVPRRGRVVDT